MEPRSSNTSIPCAPDRRASHSPWRWWLLASFVLVSTSACQAYDRALLDMLTRDGGVDALPPGCDGGICGSRCVDLLTDPANCGRCGQACTAGAACVGGSCGADSGVDGTTADVMLDAPALDAPIDSGADVTADVVADVAADVAADVTSDTVHALTPPVFRSVATATLVASSGCCLMVAQPAGSTPGDLLLAVIALGVSGTPPLPVMTPPAGWTLVRRVDHGTTTSLWIFWHVAGAAEPSSYNFATNESGLGGVGWIAAYTGVDLANPIDNENGADAPLSATTYSTPSITTVHPQSLLVATIMGHGGTAATWTPPAGMVGRVDINDGTTRSGLSAEAVQAAPGATGVRTATASMTLGYSVVDLLALAPAP